MSLDVRLDVRGGRGVGAAAAVVVPRVEEANASGINGSSSTRGRVVVVGYWHTPSNGRNSYIAFIYRYNYSSTFKVVAVVA